ncbi:MAG: hypothetical protein K2L92_00760 [Muribaculaceae bacterium]|nr:hypothetical protein [Muribaculaceae bacterium]
MKKIICIGELSLNMVLDAQGQPLGVLPGGRVANAAEILARNKFNVLMASEAAADSIGDIAVKSLTDAGVDVTSVDRFTEGRTPLNIFVGSSDGQAGSITRYEQYPDECFDIIWPRIDEDDIVVYGGFYAIDKRMRARMQRFLANAAERKAVLVYLPGFLPQLEPRITRVMPQILENLEMAHVVIARANDLSLIFGANATDSCYHDHIDFYCRSLIAIEPACRRISYYSGKEMCSVEIPESTCEGMIWNAGATAGVAAAIIGYGYTAADFEATTDELRRNVLAMAARTANAAAKTIRFPYLGF